MGRVCSQCRNYGSCSNFSRNQWTKGDGYSRCRSCVEGYSVSFTCHTCNKSFSSQNELNMHAQVHRARNVACPVCGDRRFASGANAVQHVESGYCTGCTGRDNARQQIYKFAQQQSAMNPYMSSTPRLTYGGYDGGVPDLPYHCKECSKSFRQLSQLLQHQDNKHSNTRLLTYY